MAIDFTEFIIDCGAHIFIAASQHLLFDTGDKLLNLSDAFRARINKLELIILVAHDYGCERVKIDAGLAVMFADCFGYFCSFKAT